MIFFRKPDSTFRDHALKPALQGVPEPDFKLDTVEAIDFLHAGRRGNVDLRQIIADHVNANKQKAPLPQDRSDRLADQVLAGGELCFDGSPPGMHVGTSLSVLGNAQYSA